MTHESNPLPQLITPFPIKQSHERETNQLFTLNRVPMTDLGQDGSSQQMAIRNQISERQQLLNNSTVNVATFANEQTAPLETVSGDVSQLDNNSMLQSHLQADMTIEINKYFESCASNLANFTDLRDQLVLVVNHRIKKQIKNGDLQISDKREQLNLRGSKKAKERQLEAKRRQMQHQKAEIIHKLKAIQQEEIDLVHMTIKQGRNKSLEMKKDSYTVQQKQKITEILKAKKQFEISLLQKTEEYVKNSQQLKQTEQEERRKAREAENNRKKEEITKRLKELQVKSEERKQILKRSALKINRNYIHRKLQKDFKSLQKIAQQQKQSKLQQLSAKHKLNIDQINQHDRKYTESLQKRSQSLTQLKIETQTQSKKYKPTHFHKFVDEELFQIKEKNYQRMMKVREKQYQEKIAKYQEKIDHEHKPKVDPSKSIVTVPRTYSSVTLTNEERIEKGLEYLAKAKEMKRSISQTTELPKETQSYGYKVYKDYLKQREPLNIDATQRQFKQILSNREHKDANSLLRAKFLAQGLQAKSKKSIDDKLYYSAKTKLALLSQLY